MPSFSSRVLLAKAATSSSVRIKTVLSLNFAFANLFCPQHYKLQQDLPPLMKQQYDWLEQ
jgi:hypothetical protein